MSTRTSAADIIAMLELEPLIAEGGMFRRTWTSAEIATDRPMGTAIYALFTNEEDSFSALHSLDADEVWHHYAGDPLSIVLLHLDGSHAIVVLGDDLAAGQRPQLTIAAGTWMGACVADDDDYALIGCTMSPGFVTRGYTGGMRADLLERYPGAASWIARLTRDDYAGERPQEQ